MSDSDDAQPMDSAPRDGTEIYIPVGGKARAYWDEELQTWVLSRAIHIESVSHPREWWPVPPVRMVVGKYGMKES